MKRGTKAATPSTKVVTGTFREHRDGGRAEIVVPDSLPIQPDSLTPDGELVWLDNIGRIAQLRTATELDSEIFANWCNLQGAIRKSFRNGHVPPSAYISEARKMAEQFGMFGGKSRVVQGGGSAPKGSDPFDGMFS